ncbi:hypothetical protein [Niveispirillum sp. KHB5.9]|uniref:hypothetical protein n=1 Tax=Niveispirillum sp. KHB5.9 TaxID=3400269 RepID=UPI003A8950F7
MSPRRSLAALLLATTLSLGAASVPAQAPAPLTVKNLGWRFVEFIDATQGLPLDQRVARFKAEVAVEFPAFYLPPPNADAERKAKWDTLLANSIEKFPDIRAEYERKLRAFDGDLARNLARFREMFPGFTPAHSIYLLHSLNRMDGGTREFDGKPYLIFGADMMARVHKGWASETPFFHHELFHVLHEPYLGACEAIWCGLWTEGLAVHAAATLNPDATEPELLLDFPAGMAGATRARQAESFKALLAQLDLVDDDIAGELFSTRRAPAGGDLPLRRGYYLGWLVAKEIGRTHDLPNLARMPASQVKPLLRQAVEKLARGG